MSKHITCYHFAGLSTVVCNQGIHGFVRKLWEFVQAFHKSCNAFCEGFELVWKVFKVHVLIDEGAREMLRRA